MQDLSAYTTEVLQSFWYWLRENFPDVSPVNVEENRKELRAAFQLWLEEIEKSK